MVDTRSGRRKSAPAGAPATTGRGGEPVASSGGRHRQQQAAAAPAAAGEVDYAEMYRQQARREREEEQSSFLRRWKGRIYLFYHQQAMTWGWYMLEPWETVLWMAFLLLLTYFVLSACFVNPSSICRQSLVAARNSLVAQGTKLLSLTRGLHQRNGE